MKFYIYKQLIGDISHELFIVMIKLCLSEDKFRRYLNRDNTKYSIQLRFLEMLIESRKSSYKYSPIEPLTLLIANKLNLLKFRFINDRLKNLLYSFIISEYLFETSDVTERVNYITKHIGKEIYLNIKKPFDAIMAANESTARDLLIDFKGKDREYFYNNSNSLDPIEIITNPNSHNLIPEEFIFHENIYGYKVDLIMDRLNYKVIKLNNKFETSGLNFEFKRDQLQAINREMQNIRFDMQIEAGNSIYYHFERISYKILNTITSDYSNFMTETVKIIDITLQIISNIFNL